MADRLAPELDPSNDPDRPMVRQSPSTVERSQKRHFYRGIEGIRGVAAIMITLNHVGAYTGQVGSSLYGQEGNGFFGAALAKAEAGLPIFFILSGALLYRPFALATLAGTPGPETGPYLWRRALRILPAYWTLVLLSLVLLNAEAINGLWEVVRPVLLLHIYQPNVLPAGMGQTWSLAVEVTFYLLLPAFAAAGTAFARRGASPSARARRILLLLLGVCLFSVGYTAFSHLPFMGDYPIAYLWLPEYLSYFAVGMAAATMSACLQLSLDVWAPYRWLIRRPLVSWVLAAFVFALACSPLGNPQTIDYPEVPQALAIKAFYMAFSILVVVPLTAGEHPRSVVHLLLGSAPAQFLGRISYGIFLWHLFFLDGFYHWTGAEHGSDQFWLILGFVLATTLAAAVVSYYLIERPAMRLRPRLGHAPAEQSTSIAT